MSGLRRASREFGRLRVAWDGLLYLSVSKSLKSRDAKLPDFLARRACTVNIYFKLDSRCRCSTKKNDR
jgi:hypothetical protein